MYEDEAKQLQDMGAGALVLAEYEQDFKQQIDARTGNYHYHHADGSPFRCTVVGQIMNEAVGTRIGARGNFYSNAALEDVRICLYYLICTCLTEKIEKIYYRQDNYQERNCTWSTAKWWRVDGHNLSQSNCNIKCSSSLR